MGIFEIMFELDDKRIERKLERQKIKEEKRQIREVERQRINEEKEQQRLKDKEEMEMLLKKDLERKAEEREKRAKEYAESLSEVCLEEAIEKMMWQAKTIQNQLKNKYFIHWHPKGTAYYFSKNDEDIDWFNREFPIELGSDGFFKEETIPVPDNVEKVPLVELQAILNSEFESESNCVKYNLKDYYNDRKVSKITDYYMASIHAPSEEKLRANLLEKELSRKSDANVVARGIAGAIIAGPTGAMIGVVSAIDKNAKNRTEK